MENRNSQNSFTFSGRIASIKNSDGIVVIHLATSVPVSSRQGMRANTYFPCIVFYGSRGVEAMKFAKSDRVKITAKVRTSKKVVDDITNYYQTLVGETISEATSSIEENFGVKPDANFISVDENKFSLSGTVTSVYFPENSTGTALFTIKVPEKNGYSQYPTIVAFNKIADKVKEKVKVGDYVYLAGHVHTVKKEVGDNPKKKYQSVVCDEISVVSE